MSKNNNLHKAKVAKNDEFYTQLSDIENELKHYKDHFKGKTVFCNCDDPEWSNFTLYFAQNFEHLGLKRLISTGYDQDGVAIVLDLSEDLNGDGKIDHKDLFDAARMLYSDGDFRSEESIELLKQADIVVTNPPFSLFREYITQLMEYDKKFIVLGTTNNATYKEIFPFIQDNRLWLGVNNGDMSFQVPDHYEPRATRYWQDESGQKWRSLGNISWFTNLDHNKRNEELILYKKYSEAEYNKFDNTEFLNVNKVSDIPVDYNGDMCVPITFLAKYNPNQFEVTGFHNGGNKGFTIDGKHKYTRIHIIKRK